MQREVIWSDKGPKSIAPYSHAVKVGSLVFTSGLTAMAPGSSDILPEHRNNVEGQTRQTLENLKAVLEEAGSSFEHVIKVNIYLTNMDDYAQMNAVYREYFPHEPERCPARMCFQVPRLAREDLLIEIDMVALIPE